MNSTLNIITILLFIGAAQGFLLSIVLLTLHKGNRTANRFLAIILIVFSIIIMGHSFGQLGGEPIEKPSSEHELVHNLIYLFGPFFYFYVKSLTQPKFNFRIKTWLHLLPFFISMLIYVFIHLLYANDILKIAKFYTVFSPVNMGGIIINFSVYLFLAIVLLRNHSKNIKDSYSSLEKINLNWLKFLTTSYLIIWPLALVIEIFGVHASWNLVWLLVSVFIYLMGYLSLRQPEIFVGELTGPDTTKKRYEKSALTSDKAEEYFEKLKKIMEDDKPYLDSNLTLPSLANRLSVSTHHLSQVINEKTNQNFFEFINNYRVKEAKRLLVDSKWDHLNISAIGFEAGFNSNSSFNSVFKKSTNMTPSQFRSAAK